MALFPTTLCSWYEEFARDLPWRNTRNPYHIWLSEIILQQTQVQQGLAYYHRFTSTYPRVEDLAKSSLDEVLKLWQGLGYYSRATNLHRAAQQIVALGSFPNTYEAIHSLPGVGDYTAAAIASFAFDLPYPVLDGNVARFISRCFGIREAVDTPAGKKQILEILNHQMKNIDPALFNQAVMEFGALYCKGNSPDCKACPFRSTCCAYAQEMVAELPLKRLKTAVRTRYLDYYILVEPEGIWCRQRGHNDIWRGLYDFPCSDGELRPKIPTWAGKAQQEVQHKLSHRLLIIRFFVIHKKPLVIRAKTELDLSTCQIHKHLQTLAVPKPLHTFLEEHAFFADFNIF